MRRLLKRELHGITSLFIIFAALIIADIELFRNNFYSGITYFIVFIISCLLIVYKFCTKCRCKSNCGHIIPGRLALIFGKRREGKYSRIDIMITAAALTLMIIFPQVLLWNNPVLFTVFWILLITGGLQIRTFVCRGCGNSSCPVCLKVKL